MIGLLLRKFRIEVFITILNSAFFPKLERHLFPWKWSKPCILGMVSRARNVGWAKLEKFLHAVSVDP